MPGIEVLDRPHDEAVEQRHVARCPGPGMNAAAWQELEVLQDGKELLLPGRRVLGFNGRQRTSDPTPRIGDGLLARLAIRVPILRLPNVPGNIGCKVAHRAS